MTELIENDRERYKMAAVFGNIGPFDESSEQWSSYTERFEYFVAANAITEEKVVPTFFKCDGSKDIRTTAKPPAARKTGRENVCSIIGHSQSAFLSKALRYCRAISISPTKSAGRRNRDNVCSSAKKIS